MCDHEAIEVNEAFIVLLRNECMGDGCKNKPVCITDLTGKMEHECWKRIDKIQKMAKELRNVLNSKKVCKPKC